MSTKSRRNGSQRKVAILERELYRPVGELPLLRRRIIQTAYEVAFDRKRVDLVALTSRGEIVAIEFKVKDWRRVIWQASINQLFADFSYVAVWHTAIKFMDILGLSQQGIGIIKVGESGARMVRRAKQSPVQREAHRNAMTEVLSGGDRIQQPDRTQQVS